MKVGLRIAAAALAGGFALSACTGGSSTSSGEDPAATVKASAAAMSEVTGAHVLLTSDGQVPNLKAKRLEGDLSTEPAPAATGTVTLDMGSLGEATSEFVYVDGNLYSDVAEPGKFVNYGDGNSIYSVALVLDPERGLANLLKNFQDPKDRGSEEVDGVKATKISGTASSNDVMVMAGSRMGPQDEIQLPTTLWIAQDGSNHLLKAEMEPVQDATVTLQLSDFGKQVTAEKPAQ